MLSNTFFIESPASLLYKTHFYFNKELQLITSTVVVGAEITAKEEEVEETLTDSQSRQARAVKSESLQ